MIEYRGSAIRALSMEERMTVCNMSIEAGARAGLIAPDETTFQYLADRPLAPKGAAWDAARRALARRCRPTTGAAFDRELHVDAEELQPMITWGTSPGMGIPVRGIVPDPRGDAGLEKALRYMGLEPGKPLLGRKIDVVFIGTCTNSRLTDLREAAKVLRGRRVAAGVKALVVPGSQQVKQQAEAEGLDRVFREAGAEWREPGCSMCIAMNDDRLEPGQYAVSTSNRNFEGRQGKGGRTFLASPTTAAVAAVRGAIADARELLCVKPVTEVRSPHRRAADRQRRHRPDHPGALPEVTTSRDGLGELLFADWRFDEQGTQARRLRAEPPRGRGRARAGGGPQLRLRLLARARGVGAAVVRLPTRSSAPPSRTSSAPTRSRTACCPCRWTRTPRPTSSPLPAQRS